MAYISYKKLWHLLIDRDISKTALRNATGISSSTLANMVNGHNVSLEVLLKICDFLHCDISGITEVKFDGNKTVHRKSEIKEACFNNCTK